MPELIVNPRFRDVTRPLKQEEYNALEENILRDGRVYSAIITWKNQIVDGHNRWSIIQKYPEIPYDVQEMDFADEWAVEAWICSTQLGRRNLTDEERTFMIGKQCEAEKMSQGGNRGTEHDSSGKFTASPHNEDLRRGRTTERIAKQHGIGKASVERAEKFAKGVDAAETIQPGAKEAILSGTSKVPKKVIAELPKMEPEQQKKVVRIATSGNPWDKPMTPSTQSKPKVNGKTLDATIAALYDSERVVEHTVDDLLENLSLTVEEFIRKVNRYIQIYGVEFDTLKEEGANEKVASVLSEAESEIKKIKEMFV